MESLEKELENLIKNINNGIDKTTKELGEKSLTYMKKQYMENNMSGHIGYLKVSPYNNRYKNGFILSSGDDKVAIYNEFGTGIVGAENSNPLAGDLGYEYNIESPHKGRVPEAAIKWEAKRRHKPFDVVKAELEAETTPNSWWYFKNGTWRHLNKAKKPFEGMKAKNMYSSLVDILNEIAVEKYSVSISQSLGNNGGKE